MVFVDPAYTSQTCPECRHRERSNRKSQSVFRCKAGPFHSPLSLMPGPLTRPSATLSRWPGEGFETFSPWEKVPRSGG